jgi:electron transport complex protein RnfB
MSHELANDIDKILPQTQCGECGYPGCRPYAIAIARGEASIDLCPPGGLSTLQTLARLTRQPAEPYIEEVERNTRPPALARIREAECIGCTKCIQACPVDAIIGAAKQMHTVIEPECTGCRLCIEPCPVDCIDLIELPQAQFDPDKARQRFEQRQLRQARQQQQRWQQHQQALQNQADVSERRENRQAYIQQAIARVKAKRHARDDQHE